jgi:hypothetical protein
VSRRGINRAGLAVLLPVRAGKEAVVAEALAALPTGDASPFGRIGATHFARLVLLPVLPGREPEQPACLFFAAEFDMTVAGYLEAVSGLMPDEVDAVFGSCVGYPGASAPPLFAEWMGHHRVRAGFSLHASPQARVPDVLRSLVLRDRIIEFAVSTRAFEPGALRQAWVQQDWGDAA